MDPNVATVNRQVISAPGVKVAILNGVLEFEHPPILHLAENARMITCVWYSRRRCGLPASTANWYDVRQVEYFLRWYSMWRG